MTPGELAQRAHLHTSTDTPAWKGQVCRTYAQVIRLGTVSFRKVEPRPDYSILQGNRQFGYPLMAAKVHRDLGICRHVLDQMVVAGTHMVPFGSGISILETFRPGAAPDSATQAGSAPERVPQGMSRPMHPAPRPGLTPSFGENDQPLSWDWDPLMAMAEPD